VPLGGGVEEYIYGKTRQIIYLVVNETVASRGGDRRRGSKGKIDSEADDKKYGREKKKVTPGGLVGKKVSRTTKKGKGETNWLSTSGGPKTRYIKLSGEANEIRYQAGKKEPTQGEA